VSKFNVIAWNGQMLVYERQGDDWCAHYLGDARAVAMTASLRAAIDSDLQHQVEKKEREG